MNCAFIDFFSQWEAADIVTFRTSRRICFTSLAMCAKANKPSDWGIRQGFRRGWCHAVGCDTCTSCQDREEHVGLMTRQRWSGKHDPLPQGGPVYCGFLFRGAQSRGVPRDAVSPRLSHVKPHHLPLYPMHPHLHSRFDSRPRQTPNLLAAEAPPFPWRRRTRAQRWP